MDKQEVRKLVTDQRIEVVRLFFSDVLGRLKGLNITAAELDRAMDEGIPFDGSSIEGFVRIEESDLVAVPSVSSFRIFPFSSGGAKSGFFMCDVVYPDGRPLPFCPRNVLQRTIDKAKSMGFDTYYVGPELEYFYFRDDRSTENVDSSGYFDVLPLDATADSREASLSALRQMGMKMEASHHEVAPGQHEIDFRYAEAIQMADQVMVSRLVVKQIARAHGLYASFMPKPVAGINGSGMHVHQSLFSKGNNAFYSAEDPFNLSGVGRGYTAGILAHAREMTMVTNQWVNSYKRLVPGFEAPVYVCWGRVNRSALVRVPAFSKGKAESCRIEYRAPDPGTNPYLAFAVMLAAGLDGIRRGLTLGDPAEKDIYHMSAADRESLKIECLPGDLHSAAGLAASSEVVRSALGDELLDKLVANKREEWDRFRTQVTDYEIKTYFPEL